MKTFSFSEMNRSSGDILDAALAEPVALTKRGKEKLIIITTDMWDKMKRRSAQAYTMQNAPDAIYNELMGGLEDYLRSPETKDT